VSSEVPEWTVVRAVLECPECIEKRPDIDEAITLLREVHGSGIAHIDARVSYITVQIDHELWTRLNDFLRTNQEKKP
jgi:hypothetical protein